MTFSMPSLFCLKLSLSPPIISKKHHAASADNIGVLKAPHTAPPRPHHSAPPHSVGHGPQRVPIFFGILVGTHKKSRPRTRNRRRRTPRPNGKKKKTRQKKTLRIMSSRNVRTIHQWRRCRRRRRQDWRPLPKSRKQKCLKLLQKNSWNQWRVLAWPLRTTLLCCRNLRTLHQ